MAARTIKCAFIVIIGIAVASGQYYGFEQEDCSPGGILKCKETLDSYYQPGVFDKIAANFKQFCSTLDGALNCLDKKIEKCIPSESDKDEIRNAIQLDNLQRMMNKICAPEFLSSMEGLKDEKCFGPIENELLRCKANVEKNAAVYTPEITETMHKMCCVNDELRKCTVHYLEARCTRKVADVTNTFLSELTQNPQCDRFKSGEVVCDQYLPYISSKGNFMQPWCTWIFPFLASTFIMSFF